MVCKVIRRRGFCINIVALVFTVRVCILLTLHHADLLKTPWFKDSSFRFSGPLRANFLATSVDTSELLGLAA
jgi:hypothetical protein